MPRRRRRGPGREVLPDGCDPASCLPAARTEPHRDEGRGQFRSEMIEVIKPYSPDDLKAVADYIGSSAAKALTAPEARHDGAMDRKSRTCSPDC